MLHYAENGFLTIAVREYGCELASVKSKKDGYEFLWQGNKEIWHGQSPILFPTVGRLIDDRYTLNGTEYEMPKHGFARKAEWTLLEEDGDSLTFILSDSPETLVNYPYKFDLTVTFTLDANKLRVNHAVVNKNEEIMYFSLGAHPAFNCSIGDTLRFSEKETLATEKIDLERSLRLPEAFPVLKNATDITLTEHIFDEDALIFKGIKSRYISLIKQNDRHTVKFDTGNAPYLGIWAKPGAPYVCIEPWFGVNDSFEKKNDFSEKEGINALAPDDVFTFAWEAEFSL